MASVVGALFAADVASGAVTGDSNAEGGDDGAAAAPWPGPAGGWARSRLAGATGRSTASRPLTSGAAGRASTASRIRVAADTPRTGATRAETLASSSESVKGRAALPRVCSARTSTGPPERVATRRTAASRAQAGSRSSEIRSRSLAISGSVATSSLNSASPARPYRSPAAIPCRALNRACSPLAGCTRPMSSGTSGLQVTDTLVIDGESPSSGNASSAASMAGCATTPHG